MVQLVVQTDFSLGGHPDGPFGGPFDGPPGGPFDGPNREMQDSVDKMV